MSIDLDLALPYLSPSQSPEDTAPVHAYGSADAPIVRPFSPSLLVSYVIDEPGALLFVRERDVPAKGTAREDLHARALTNLRRRVERKTVRFEPRGPISRARLDGQHDASLLLLDEIWDAPERLAGHEGDLLAIVPARGTLVFTATARAGAMQELRAHTERPSLSAEIFVRRDRCWHPLPIGTA
ncbi:MAG: hypothetical protein KIT84_15575 [Labilithrix sp.]|nr:hypothetical protein [Labilithrix sp.]MCW5812446.1 hypothetical protein [Labilithrix sp.]